MTACGLFTEGTTLGSVARKSFEERKIPIHLTEVNGHIKSGLKMETVLFQLNGSQFCGELCQFNTFVAKKKQFTSNVLKRSIVPHLSNQLCALEYVITIVQHL